MPALGGHEERPMTARHLHHLLLVAEVAGVTMTALSPVRATVTQTAAVHLPVHVREPVEIHERRDGVAARHDAHELLIARQHHTGRCVARGACAVHGVQTRSEHLASGQTRQEGRGGGVDLHHLAVDGHLDILVALGGVALTQQSVAVSAHRPHLAVEKECEHFGAAGGHLLDLLHVERHMAGDVADQMRVRGAVGRGAATLGTVKVRPCVVHAARPRRQYGELTSERPRHDLGFVVLEHAQQEGVRMRNLHTELIRGVVPSARFLVVGVERAAHTESAQRGGGGPFGEAVRTALSDALGVDRERHHLQFLVVDVEGNHAAHIELFGGQALYHELGPRFVPHAQIPRRHALRRHRVGARFEGRHRPDGSARARGVAVGLYAGVPARGDPAHAQVGRPGAVVAQLTAVPAHQMARVAARFLEAEREGVATRGGHQRLRLFGGAAHTEATQAHLGGEVELEVERGGGANGQSGRFVGGDRHLRNGGIQHLQVLVVHPFGVVGRYTVAVQARLPRLTRDDVVVGVRRPTAVVNVPQGGRLEDELVRVRATHGVRDIQQSGVRRMRHQRRFEGELPQRIGGRGPVQQIAAGGVPHHQRAPLTVRIHGLDVVAYGDVRKGVGDARGPRPPFEMVGIRSRDVLHDVVAATRKEGTVHVRYGGIRRQEHDGIVLMAVRGVDDLLRPLEGLAQLRRLGERRLRVYERAAGVVDDEAQTVRVVGLGARRAHHERGRLQHLHARVDDGGGRSRRDGATVEGGVLRVNASVSVRSAAHIDIQVLTLERGGQGLLQSDVHHT